MLVGYSFISLYFYDFLPSKRTENTVPPPSVKQADVVKLKSLKVAGANLEIKDEIDLKKTVAEKLSVEWKATPDDAVVTFTPELVSGNWELGSELGSKTLQILVKKEDESHTYKITVEKIKADSLLLKKISCEEEEKNAKEAAAQPTQQVEKSTLGDLDVLQELKDKMEKEQ